MRRLDTGAFKLAVVTILDIFFSHMGGLVVLAEYSESETAHRISVERNTPWL